MNWLLNRTRLFSTQKETSQRGWRWPQQDLSGTSQESSQEGSRRRAMYPEVLQRAVGSTGSVGRRGTDDDIGVPVSLDEAFFCDAGIQEEPVKKLLKALANAEAANVETPACDSPVVEKNGFWTSRKLRAALSGSPFFSTPPETKKSSVKSVRFAQADMSVLDFEDDLDDILDHLTAALVAARDVRASQVAKREVVRVCQGLESAATTLTHLSSTARFLAAELTALCHLDDDQDQDDDDHNQEEDTENISNTKTTTTQRREKNYPPLSSSLERGRPLVDAGLNPLENDLRLPQKKKTTTTNLPQQSQLWTRHTEVLSSVLRKEMKRQLNETISIAPGTGSVRYNVDDPAALLHRALEILHTHGGPRWIGTRTQDPGTKKFAFSSYDDAEDVLGAASAHGFVLNVLNHDDVREKRENGDLDRLMTLAKLVRRVCDHTDVLLDTSQPTSDLFSPPRKRRKVEKNTVSNMTNLASLGALADLDGLLDVLNSTADIAEACSNDAINFLTAQSPDATASNESGKRKKRKRKRHRGGSGVLPDDLAVFLFPEISAYDEEFLA